MVFQVAECLKYDHDELYKSSLNDGDAKVVDLLRDILKFEDNKKKIMELQIEQANQLLTLIYDVGL